MCMKKQLNFAINNKVSESPTENIYIYIYFKQRRKNETFFLIIFDTQYFHKNFITKSSWQFIKDR